MTQHYAAPDDRRVHAVLVGPIRKDMTLSDGTVVDVRPDVVFVESLEHAHELAHLVGEHYAANGHPFHDDGDPFVHDVELSKSNLAAHPLNREV